MISLKDVQDWGSQVQNRYNYPENGLYSLIMCVGEPSVFFFLHINFEETLKQCKAGATRSEFPRKVFFVSRFQVLSLCTCIRENKFSVKKKCLKTRTTVLEQGSSSRKKNLTIFLVNKCSLPRKDFLLPISLKRKKVNRENNVSCRNFTFAGSLQINYTCA